jgi:trans-2,3-dihydro-3-hydroxyanthranilate isomerase
VALFAEADRAHPFESLGFALFLYVPMRADGTELAARMFAPLDNVLEDPATGSASAALAAFRATLAQPGDGAHSSVIMQGEDMGRPSKIELVAHISGGQVSRVVVGGACVPVMRGTLTLA